MLITDLSFHLVFSNSEKYWQRAERTQRWAAKWWPLTTNSMSSKQPRLSSNLQKISNTHFQLNTSSLELQYTLRWSHGSWHRDSEPLDSENLYNRNESEKAKPSKEFDVKIASNCGRSDRLIVPQNASDFVAECAIETSFTIKSICLTLCSCIYKDNKSNYHCQSNYQNFFT